MAVVITAVCMNVDTSQLIKSQFKKPAYKGNGKQYVGGRSYQFGGKDYFAVPWLNF